jgi:hypothetical protein
MIRHIKPLTDVLNRKTLLFKVRGEEFKHVSYYTSLDRA